MIPKIIHYCWFGGAETELVHECVASWKANLGDYQIVKWDENNFNFRENTLAEKWYRAKLYSFVADYARAKILFEHGGIYLDSDILILPGRNFDSLLAEEAFIGFQFPWPNVCGPDSLENNRIGIGVIGSVPKSSFSRDLYGLFLNSNKKSVFDIRHKDFVLPVDHVRNLLISYGLQSYGMQTINGVKVLPKAYFLQGLMSPSSHADEHTEETICVHMGALAWKPILAEQRQPAARRIGKKILSRIGLLNAAKTLREYLFFYGLLNKKEYKDDF